MTAGATDSGSGRPTAPTVATCLWFDDQALPAATLYTSLVPDSEILGVSHYGPENSHGETAAVLQVEFRLGSQRFVALNGGPHFTLTPAASIQVYCPDQAEVDRLWEALTADGGQESRCAWLVDRFGLSWQIIPTRLVELIGDPDPEVSARVVAAMLTMGKIDVAALDAAAAGPA
jgi:predicted 3-demethylubiquinone-9 3-methyltransferase (glyoxalase superfamily)